MGESHREEQTICFHFGFVADADYVKRAFEARVNARDHIENERAGKPVKRAYMLYVAIARKREHVVFNRKFHAVGDFMAQFAERSLCGDLLAFYLKLNFIGYAYRAFTYS